MTAVDRERQDEAGMSRFATALLLALFAAAAARARIRLASDRFILRQESDAMRPDRQGKSPSMKIARLRRVRHVLMAVYESVVQHRVMAIAAGVAFFSLLAVFPALAALVSLYGFVADAHAITKELRELEGVLPNGAIDVIRNQLVRVASQEHGTLGMTFLISLLISLWSANSGMTALFDALNVVRGEAEQRSLVKLYAVSFAFTAGTILFAILAIGAIVVLPLIFNFFGLGSGLPGAVAVLRWPALFLVVAFALALTYRYGPYCSIPKWHWVSLGSLCASCLWLGASYLFSWYTANFGSYNKTYGSLGAVVVFMTWLWISFVVILLGAELDVAIHRHGGPAAEK